MDLVIYGAQGYALAVYKALKTLYPRRVIRCFLVTKMGTNESTLAGIPVKEIGPFSAEMSAEKKRNVEVFIATPENVQSEIEETLESFGFLYYRRLNAKRWDELMKLFHAKLGRFLPLAALPVGFHMPFTRIYMAKSHVDKALKNVCHLPEYVVPIQVGSDCCDVRIADLTDNRGEHISKKNGNYSELTALYWIWKNKLAFNMASEDEGKQYYGLSQYRRMFDFDDDDLLRLVDNDVDAVLPYPLPYEPDIHVHHERYLAERDWNIVMDVLRERQPEYIEDFIEILKQQYLYNYNVILAKKNVLKDYCEWLFPILEEVEERSVPKGCDRCDRYIGYIGETLETLYFMKNSVKLNIVHAHCRLLI